MRVLTAIFLLLIVGVLGSQAIIAIEEEAPINRFRTRFLVQYILEGDIIMVNECECIPSYECDDKNSIELVKYKCRGYNSVCCVGGSKRTNEIESA